MIISKIKLCLLLFLPQLAQAVPKQKACTNGKTKNCVQKSPHAFYRTCQSYFDCQYHPDGCDSSVFFKCDGNKCVCELFGFSREEFGMMAVNWNKAEKTCHIGLEGPCGVDNGIRVHCEPGQECVNNKCKMIEKNTSGGCDESTGCEMGKEKPPCADPDGCEFGRLTRGGADYFDSSEIGSASQAHDRERERQYEQQPCEVTNSCENQSANQEHDREQDRNQDRYQPRQQPSYGNGNGNRKQDQEKDAAWDALPPFRIYRYGKTDSEPPGSSGSGGSGGGGGNGCEEDGPGCTDSKPSGRPPLGPRQGPPKPKNCEEEGDCGENESKPSARPRPSRPRPGPPKPKNCEEEDGCGATKTTRRPSLGRRQGPPKPKACDEGDECGEEAKPSSRPPIGRRANRPPKPRESCDEEDGCGDSKPSTRPPLGPRQGPPKPKPCDDCEKGDDDEPPPPPPPKRSCNGGSCGGGNNRKPRPTMPSSSCDDGGCGGRRTTTKKPKFSCGDEGCGDSKSRTPKPASKCGGEEECGGEESEEVKRPTRPPRGNNGSNCGGGGCRKTTTTTTTTTESPCKKDSNGKKGCENKDEDETAECDKFWPKMFASQCPQRLRGNRKK